jgi:cellulose synthase/poly-beta-1,6-N-acetylglucosamine synthase-like glycosyltransferase
MPLVFPILILLIVYSGLFFYYRYWWGQAGNIKPDLSAVSKTRFSIIIPARNEALNIGACLSSIQQLNYPSDLFEVIVVDDHSDDNTAAIASGFPFVKLISLTDFIKDPVNSYKKQALGVAIKQSSGEYIITTDADCILSPNWLRSFDQIIQQKQPAFIAAPVIIENRSGWLNKFETIDFMMLQAITVAAVESGAHAMSNGANLCFKKSAFEAVRGYENVDTIASGDDMLLMQKIADQYPDQIAYCKSKEAIVRTRGTYTLRAFISQRIRWASKGKYYRGITLKMILLSVYILNLALAFCLCLAFYDYYYLKIFVVAIFFKTAIELLLMIPAAKFFDKKHLLNYYLPFQPLHILYMLIAGTFGNFGKYEWKGRRVR